VIAMREDPLRGEATVCAVRAFACVFDEHLGIGAAGQPHELQLQTLLE